MRVNRQALVLRRYYELLADAIMRRQEEGAHYLVVSLGAQAGEVLGEDQVAVSSVRLWHAEYFNGNGLLRADERGHYTRELLVTEEDVNNKFVKWSLKMAKNDELSVESAQDFLNNELLCSLEVCMHAAPAQTTPTSHTLSMYSLHSLAPSPRSQTR